MLGVYHSWLYNPAHDDWGDDLPDDGPPPLTWDAWADSWGLDDEWMLVADGMLHVGNCVRAGLHEAKLHDQRVEKWMRLRYGRLWDRGWQPDRSWKNHRDTQYRMKWGAF